MHLSLILTPPCRLNEVYRGVALPPVAEHGVEHDYFPFRLLSLGSLQ
jgi:hypothetical protein